MNNSFNKINYTLRTKKQIERKIIIDLLKQLQNKFSIKLDKYKYIGMGSIYYYDFILFHKYLEIDKMISLDNKNTIKRFKFNKPYDFILFKNMSTTEYLSEYSLNSKSLIWFDYDSVLYNAEKDFKNDYILEDIQLVVDKAHAKSIFILTLNVSYSKKEFKKKLINEYKEYISLDFKPHQLNDISGCEIINNILLNFIEDSQKYKENKFFKLFSFYYRDGAPMLSIGGIIDKNNDIQKKMENDKFFNINEEFTNIDVPILTKKEKTYLDSKIRNLKKSIDKYSSNKTKLQSILKVLKFEIGNIKNLKNYIDYYKYYPQYFESII